VGVLNLSLTVVNTRGSRPMRPMAYPTRVVAVELAFDPAIPLLTRAITTAMKPRPQTLLASPVHGSSELKLRKLVM
jgi:hypothetical protein